MVLDGRAPLVEPALVIAVATEGTEMPLLLAETLAVQKPLCGTTSTPPATRGDCYMSRFKCFCYSCYWSYGRIGALAIKGGSDFHTMQSKQGVRGGGKGWRTARPTRGQTVACAYGGGREGMMAECDERPPRLPLCVFFLLQFSVGLVDHGSHIVPVSGVRLLQRRPHARTWGERENARKGEANLM